MDEVGTASGAAAVRAVVCGGAWFINDELVVERHQADFFAGVATDALQVNRIALAGHLVLPTPPRSPLLCQPRPLLRVRLDTADWSAPLPGIVVPCPSFLDEPGFQAYAAAPAPDGIVRFYVNLRYIVVPRPGRYNFVLDIDEGRPCRVPFEVSGPAKDD
jgi:hypothetical protein